MEELTRCFSLPCKKLNQGINSGGKNVNCIHKIHCCITCRIFFFFGLAFTCHDYETQDSLIKCYASHVLPGEALIREHLDSYAKNKSIFQKISFMLNNFSTMEEFRYLTLA